LVLNGLGKISSTAEKGFAFAAGKLGLSSLSVDGVDVYSGPKHC
jgi:hypothetical protein